MFCNNKKVGAPHDAPTADRLYASFLIIYQMLSTKVEICCFNPQPFG